MRKSVLAVALSGVLVLTGISVVNASPGAGSPAAEFRGTVGEIVDTPPDTGVPRRWMRHVGTPAPDGYSHGYQWGAPSITTAPGDIVTFEGTIDVADATTQDFALIGLLDTANLADGDRGHQEGAYVYATIVGGDTLRIGPSDGGAAGEYNQVFHDIDLTDGESSTVDVTFIIDPTADPATCASNPADIAASEGCLYVTVNNLPTLADSYGTFTDAGSNGGVELVEGGTAGWDGPSRGVDHPEGDAGIDYDMTIWPVVVLDPQDNEDCKNGGWEQYGFSNQGQCIRFVNSGKDSR